LGDPRRAAKQFEDVLRRVEADGTGLDFTIYTQFYHSFGEYCLLVGDIAQARLRAMQLHDYAAPAPDRNHLALAYGLLARIAFAAGDLEEARAQLTRALATLDDENLPLAAWRIYLAAAEIYQGLGETHKASQYRGLFETVMQTLAQNFAAEDPLRASLLAAIESKREGFTAGPAPS
jgi:tetratricopeptide (TPR) repeat protein